MGSVDMVKRLLEESTLDVNAVDKLKNTALHLAATAAHGDKASEEIMFWLLSHPKINLSSTNKEGKTASDLNPNCNMTWRDKRAAVKSEGTDPVVAVSIKREVPINAEDSPPRKRAATRKYDSNVSKATDTDDDVSSESHEAMQFEATQRQSRQDVPQETSKSSSSSSMTMLEVAKRTLSELDDKEKELERELESVQEQQRLLRYSIRQMESGTWR
jgi:hypothetical protein